PHEPAAVQLVRAELARGRRVLPVALTARRMRLAMADPLDLAAVDDVRFQSGRVVEAVVATPADILEGLDRAYGGAIDRLLEALPRGGAAPRAGAAPDGSLEEAARSAPVVRLVKHVLERAIEENASDIHIEEHGGEVRVRFRT